MAKTAIKAKATKTTTKKTSKAKTVAKSVTTKAKVASKTKKTTAKSKKRSKTTSASEEVLNETGNRKTSDRRQQNSKPVATERRKTVRRRRQIDPTTCERDYTEQEIQFMHAMDEYKQLSGRMFPTCSEILEVLSKLGYRQIADVQTVYDPDADRNVASADGDDGSDFESESCV